MLRFTLGLNISTIAKIAKIVISFRGRHHQQDIILQSVRWYVAHLLSYRNLEGLMQERGYAVDHSTIQRGVVLLYELIE